MNFLTTIYEGFDRWERSHFQQSWPHLERTHWPKWCICSSWCRNRLWQFECARNYWSRWYFNTWLYTHPLITPFHVKNIIEATTKLSMLTITPNNFPNVISVQLQNPLGNSPTPNSIHITMKFLEKSHLVANVIYKI